VSTFAVIREHGPAWNAALAMRQQAAWDEHAGFMDGLAAEGFVVLGGPLGDGARVLLAIEAESAQAVEERLARDPWSRMGLLRVASIEPWQVLLRAGG
jgi:uncharacterized protein YciI